jgi:hypothetical protein
MVVKRSTKEMVVKRSTKKKEDKRSTKKKEDKERIDASAEPSGLPVVFQTDPNPQNVEEYIQWANGRRERQPGSDRTVVADGFKKAAAVFFEPLLSNRKLEMDVKSTTGRRYTIIITVPFFDLTDFRGVAYRFNGSGSGLHDWLHSRFTNALSKHLGKAVEISRQDDGSPFVDIQHGWIRNVVGINPERARKGPANSIAHFACYCAGLKETIQDGRFLWIGDGAQGPPPQDTPTDESVIEEISTEPPPQDTPTDESVIEEISTEPPPQDTPTDESVIEEISTEPTSLDSAIRFISETALVDPGSFTEAHVAAIQKLSRTHFASASDTQLLDDIMRLVASEDDVPGADVVNAFQEQAFSLNHLFVEHSGVFPDECLDPSSFAPAETTKLHLVRFTNLCKRYADRLVKPTTIRVFLCETSEGLADLHAAGMTAVATNGRVSGLKHWIINSAQLRRVMAQQRVQSPVDVPATLLDRLGHQIDHLFPNQYFGRRGVLLNCDVLLNYALLPRWLNLHRQFVDGYGTTKIAYIGTTSHIMLRTYSVGVANDKAERTRALFAELFSDPAFCHRTELAKRLQRAIGDVVSEALGRQLTAAMGHFQANEAVSTSRGQRRIDTLFCRKRRLDEQDS